MTRLLFVLGRPTSDFNKLYISDDDGFTYFKLREYTYYCDILTDYCRVCNRTFIEF
jgi:hypothetical protein